MTKPPPSAHTPYNIQIQLVNKGPARSDTQQSLPRPSSVTSFAQVANATASNNLHASNQSSPSDENGPHVTPNEDVQENLADVSSNGHNLTRSNSQRSNRSSSGSSFFSQISGKRPITPLYNLEYHKLLPTVITDAGTEAKVARVLKKGIEIHDIAQIEAVEMTASGQRPPRANPVTIASPSPDAPKSPVKPDPKPLPGDNGSTLSETVSNTSDAQPSKDATFLSRFKRMSFKPKDLGIKPPATSSPPFLSSLRPPSFSGFKAPSFGKSATATSASNGGASATVLDSTASAQQSQSLALPMFKVENPSGNIQTPIGRHATGYVWSVRKYLRPDMEGKESQLDLTIEWRKSKRWSKSRVRQRQGSSRPSSPTGSPNPEQSRRSVDFGRASISGSSKPRISHDYTRPSTEILSDTLEEPSQLLRAKQTSHVGNEDGRRLSMMSARTGDEHGADSGDESDPEDSETPWSCELVIPPPTSMTESMPHSTRRIRLGVFKPAPHHPRVIGQLNIPLSLRRVPLGLPQDNQFEGTEPQSMSAEEMKDLLCITLLWLCIRESLYVGHLPRHTPL